MKSIQSFDSKFDIRLASGHNGVVGVAGDPNAADFTVIRAPTLQGVIDPNGDMTGSSIYTDTKLSDPFAN